MADKFLILLDAYAAVVGQNLQLTLDHLLQDVRQGNASQFLEVLYARGTFGQLVWLAVDLHLNLVVMMVVFMVMFMPVVLFSRALVRLWRIFALDHMISAILLMFAGIIASLEGKILRGAHSVKHLFSIKNKRLLFLAKIDIF